MLRRQRRGRAGRGSSAYLIGPSGAGLITARRRSAGCRQARCEAQDAVAELGQCRVELARAGRDRAGAVAANLIFALPAVTISTKDRASAAHFLSEVIATLGLLLVIFAL